VRFNIQLNLRRSEAATLEDKLKKLQDEKNTEMYLINITRITGKSVLHILASWRRTWSRTTATSCKQ
jgi:hypothetical protein